ncbi:hypothetical protein ACQ4LE_008282 [Meloidogyne hapla]|uniref:Uncharacterized protein n=1 Tax=Meloidogyne hapla TaxID=6305 RepID=A0A1I8B3F3_MELHA
MSFINFFSSSFSTSSNYNRSQNLLKTLPRLMICFWAFLLILNFMEKIEAMPIDNNKEIYLATILRDSDGQAALIPLENEQLLRFFAQPKIEIAKQRKRRRDLNSLELLARQQETSFLAKKYDRNCFFSPVQCTLQQWGDGNPADDVLIGGGSGRRRRR